MKITISALTTEIRKIIEDSIAAGRIMPMPWIVQGVLAKHPVIYDKKLIGSSKCDSDFTELARREFVYAKVRSVLRLFKQPDADLPTLPGYEHLLRAYLIDRAIARDEAAEVADEADTEIETSTIVPIDDATDEELLAKADEYDAMSDGLRAHAVELRRYVAVRREERSEDRAS